MTMDLESYLEAAGARRASGGEWVMDCPFCGKAKHLYVTSEDKEGYGDPRPAGCWICFRCGERGRRMYKLVAELDGISLAEARALVQQWKYAGISWRRDFLRQQEPPDSVRPAQSANIDPEIKPEIKPEIPAWLPAEFEPIQRAWPKYMNSRGIPKVVARRFGLGVCRSGEYAHRIIFPIRCPAGTGFTARSLVADEPLRYKSGPSAGHLLFGWETLSWHPDAPLVIVEGPFDAMKVYMAGYAAVALLGKDLRAAQVEMLQRQLRLGRRLVVMLDMDAMATSIRAAERMHGSPDIAWLDSGDPGDSTCEQIVAAVESAIDQQQAYQIYMSRRI